MAFSFQNVKFYATCNVWCSCSTPNVFCFKELPFGLCGVSLKAMFGLSYVKRPILGDHLKAHTLKTGGFHMKSGGFCEKWWFSYGTLINQLTQHKFFSLMVCWGEAMSQDSMKTAAFHMKTT